MDPAQSFKSRSIQFSQEGNDIQDFLLVLKNENESYVDMYINENVDYDTISKNNNT